MRGTMQVTPEGFPLHLSRIDSAAGDATGRAVWWAGTRDGGEVGAAPARPPGPEPGGKPIMSRSRTVPGAPGRARAG